MKFHIPYGIEIREAVIIGQTLHVNVSSSSKLYAPKCDQYTVLYIMCRFNSVNSNTTTAALKSDTQNIWFVSIAKGNCIKYQRSSKAIPNVSIQF